MTRIAALELALALLLSACVPALPNLQQPDNAPTVDSQATNNALATVQVEETLNALPTPTLEPATDTPEPTVTDTPVLAATGTFTPDPNVSVTASVTETAFTATPTITGTPFTPTPTETLHPRFYGTLPPAIPYGKVTLINKSKAEAYISLDCTTVDGYTTIIEYPVAGRKRVSAPAGSYTYVAWIGGREFEGWFNLGKSNEVEITLFKDKVAIK